MMHCFMPNINQLFAHKMHSLPRPPSPPHLCPDPSFLCLQFLSARVLYSEAFETFRTHSRRSHRTCTSPPPTARPCPAAQPAQLPPSPRPARPSPPATTAPLQRLLPCSCLQTPPLWRGHNCLVNPNGEALRNEYFGPPMESQGRKPGSLCRTCREREGGREEGGERERKREREREKERERESLRESSSRKVSNQTTVS